MSANPDEARRLFRYVAGEEWREYRAIMAVFAGTFFAEFTPDDVTARLTVAGEPFDLDATVVADRLESLRAWGNLTVSSSVGNPANLADYYRRRNRYLITRAGQEVHGLVEGVLSRVDQMRDVSTGRLRTLLDALTELGTLDVERADPERIADLVRAVFDPHVAFTDEITQFFAAINQWQSRYDLSSEEFRFFAEILVGYVADRLDEIERLARPIGRRLAVLESRVAEIVERAAGGLAARVEGAGLAGAIAVGRLAGSDRDDWDHLAAWFVARAGAPSRIERLKRDAIAAIRTLTLNLTRLSRVGLGAASRRADFLRLAVMFDGAVPDVVARVAAAAFGLHSANHFGVLAGDANDPVAVSTSWADAPRAEVPVSIRERGDTTNRGRPTPMTDRRAEQEMLRRRREAERRARERVDAELLAVGDLDGAELSVAAVARLQQLIGRSSHHAQVTGAQRWSSDAGLRCIVRRRAGASTVVRCAHGVLSLLDVEVRIEAEPSAADASTVVVGDG